MFGDGVGGADSDQTPRVRDDNARVLNLARSGETQKAYAALTPSVVADASDPAVREKFYTMTPQTDGSPLLPELVADCPGVAPFQVNRKVFVSSASPRRLEISPTQRSDSTRLATSLTPKSPSRRATTSSLA